MFHNSINVTMHLIQRACLSIVLCCFCTHGFAHSVPHAHAETPTDGATDTESPLELLSRYRETGDDTHLDRAWGLLRDARHHPDALPEARLSIALIAQARHDFTYALELAEQAALDPAVRDEALLLIAAVNLVIGETKAASAACHELSRSVWPIIVGCHARVAHATGQSAQVVRQMERITGQLGRLKMDESHKAWLWSIAGDIHAASSDAPNAIKSYMRSLDSMESVQTRAALVDVLIADAQYVQARAVLAPRAVALPLQIRHMIINIADGTGVDERLLRRTDVRFRDWIAEGDYMHAREMAMFYSAVLPDPELAHALARINLKKQREPEDIELHSRTRGALTQTTKPRER